MVLNKLLFLANNNTVNDNFAFISKDRFVGNDVENNLGFTELLRGLMVLGSKIHATTCSHSITEEAAFTSTGLS